MERLNDIFNSLNELYKDKARLYSLKGIEKTSLFLGVIATIFFISVFLLLILIFGSIALACFLNDLWGSSWLGYLTVCGGYLVCMIILLIWMSKRNQPLLTGVFIRALISIFNISNDEDNRSEKSESRN